MGNMTKQEQDARACNGGFMSSLTQRDSVYRGDDTPRLWTGSNKRQTGMLVTGSINKPAPPVAGKPFTGYYGTLRVDYAPDPKQLGSDIQTLQQMKGDTFDPDCNDDPEVRQGGPAVFSEAGARRHSRGQLHDARRPLSGKCPSRLSSRSRRADLAGCTRYSRARQGYESN